MGLGGQLMASKICGIPDCDEKPVKGYTLCQDHLDQAEKMKPGLPEGPDRSIKGVMEEHKNLEAARDVAE
jgi:hypothetical protein